MKTVAIIPARLGGERLPDKVLREVAGRPLLAHAVRRAQQAGRVSQVVVATTLLDRDRPLVELCEGLGVQVWRGPDEDVLARVHGAARAARANIIVRVAPDCPFVDPGVIDRIVGEFLARLPGIDYAGNVAPVRSWPRGLDTEVFGFAALNRAWREDHDPTRRRDVTACLSGHPDRFRLHNVLADTDESHHRWTVESAADLALADAVCAHFGDDDFGWRDVLAHVDRMSAPAASTVPVGQNVLA